MQKRLCKTPSLRHTKNFRLSGIRIKFGSWLHVIANRLCLDWLRKQKRRQDQKLEMQSLEDTRPEEKLRNPLIHNMCRNNE